MYLSQVEHCWLNDYVTVSASVSGELLPTSVTFHEVTQSINLLTAQVLLFRHEIPGTNRRQDTHSLSVGPVTVDSVDCRRSAAACIRVLRICTTHRLVHRRSNCLLNLLCWPTLYFRLYRSLRIESEGSDSENVLLCRERPLPQQTPWAHCLLRSARAHTTASTFHACVKFNLVVNYSRSVFSVQFILFLRQSLFKCLVL